MVHDYVFVEAVTYSVGLVEICFGKVVGAEIETESEDYGYGNDGYDLVLVVIDKSYVGVDVVVVVVGDEGNKEEG